MKIHQLYFSPTGSTEKVVRLMGSQWDGEHCDLDFSVADQDYRVCSFPREALCIVGVPSFGGRVPAIALEHLKQMKASHTPTVLVTTYGNRDYDDTLPELRDTLRQQGFHVIAAIAAVTQHSIMHQFGAGRPDESDVKELRGYAEQIKQALAGGDDLPEAAVKGNTPYRSYNGLPLKPKAGRECTRCGACALVCPAAAIPRENPSQTQEERCITCMRCVSVCPQHARKLNPVLLFAAGKKMEKGCSAPKENALFMGVRP